MKAVSLIEIYKNHPQIEVLLGLMDQNKNRIHISGLIGSAAALTAASVFDQTRKQQYLIVLPDKEQAAYFYNDLEGLFDESDTDFNKKKI